MDFDIERFKKIKFGNDKYTKQLNRLKKDGIDTSMIEETIDSSVNHISGGTRAFVIFGEPQSGKTEMMVCLTSKLLDIGKKVIIILLNDNNTLLGQNLDRFKHSKTDPDPKDYSDILNPHIDIGKKNWVIFCKKNPKNLPKLISKVGKIKGKVIIDDEADYATPNSKINQKDKSKINALIGKLYNRQGKYIGVTATPARLDLNNTFENANDKWIYFKPHSNYTGQDVFFPLDTKSQLKYNLEFLDESLEEKESLRNALFSFLVTVGHRNSKIEKEEVNYSMLIHTSRKNIDHDIDYETIIETLNILTDQDHENFEKYIIEMGNIANKKYGKESVNRILDFVISNIPRHSVTVMNSKWKKSTSDWNSATDPKSLFTIIIGGDIVSRGVTFKNLLSMFFTRDVKGKMKQDTYIQRARMFGTRNKYIQDFELWIPEQLYSDLHRAFFFHRLALQSITTNNGPPVWLEDSRVSVTSGSSIDKTTVSMNDGEMGFEIFEYNKEINSKILEAYNNEDSGIGTLKDLNKLIGNNKLPNYLIKYVENILPDGKKSIAIHKSSSIKNWKDADQEKIERAKKFMGTNELEERKFPEAIHHFKIMYNDRGKARLYYKFVGGIKFIKNMKKDLRKV